MSTPPADQPSSPPPIRTLYQAATAAASVRSDPGWAPLAAVLRPEPLVEEAQRAVQEMKKTNRRRARKEQ